MEFKISEHILVPKHEKLEKTKEKELLLKYNVSKLQLPKISKNDPAIKELDAKLGDIIKITRNSATAGKTIFFRVVTGE